MKKLFNFRVTATVCIVAALALSKNSFGQSVGINYSASSANQSALLDVSIAGGAKKGVLIPRMLSSERIGMSPLPAPAQGLIVYQTDGAEGFYYNTSTTTTANWIYLLPGSGSSGGWSVNGNAGLSSSNFLGTTDATPLIFKTGSGAVERMRILASGNGNVGVGLTNPAMMFTVKGAFSDLDAAHTADFFNEGGYGVLLGGNFTGTASSVYGSIQSHGPANAIAPLALNAVMGGNVGVGTFTPLYPLHVKKAENTGDGTGILVENPDPGANAAAFIKFRNSLGASSEGTLAVASSAQPPYGAVTANNLVMYTTNSAGIALMADVASGSIRFAAGGNAERMRINNDGNVGIGTTAPAELLHVWGAASANAAIKISSNNGFTNNFLKVVDGVGFGLQVQRGDAAILMAFDNTNLRTGIGAASPGTKFQVTGSDANNQVGAGVNAVIKVVNTDISTGGRLSEIQFGHTSANKFAAISGAISDASSNTRGDILFSTRNLPSDANLTERMRIDGAGNIGIGNANPSYKVDIASGSAGGVRVTGTGSSNGMVQIRDNDNAAGPHLVIWPSSTGNGVLRFQKSGISSWDIYDRSTSNDAPGALKGLTIRNNNMGVADIITFLGNGNVGLGTTSPQSNLHISTPTPRISLFDTDAALSSTNPSWTVRCQNDGYFKVQSTADYSTFTNRMVIDANGNTGIGTSAPAYPLQVVGAIHASGVVYCNSSALCSDNRFKKNITPLQNALANVMKIEGVHYFWKTSEFPEKQFTADKQIGFIAQEIEKIYPELVVTDKAGYKMVDYARLTPILVEAMKEQQALIEKQQKNIEQLNSENSDVKKRLEKVEAMLGANTKDPQGNK